MAEDAGRTQGFAAEGRVVEILDRAGDRRTRIVLQPGTVIDVPASAASDLHLGDSVVVEAVIAVERVRPTTPGRRPGPRTSR
jgi:hypothetical protein